MSKNIHQQGVKRGRARKIIVSFVILVIIGALGYILWSNYVQKNANAVVTKTKTFTYNKISLSFNYPSNWVISDDAKLSSGTVTAPDSNLTLHYGIVSTDNMGGDCGLSAPGDSYSVTSLAWQPVPSISDVIFSQLGTKYVSGSSSTTYSYEFGLINDSDNSFRNGKVGDYACNVDKISAGFIKTVTNADGSQYALSFYGSFKDLDAGANVTQAQIDKDFASGDAKTAGDILKSASIK